MNRKTLANRRHHLQRVKAKFKKLEKARGSRVVYTDDFDMDRHIGILARTRQRCSCMGCGNMCKWEGDKSQDKSLTQLLSVEERLAA